MGGWLVRGQQRRTPFPLDILCRFLPVLALPNHCTAKEIDGARLASQNFREIDVVRQQLLPNYVKMPLEIHGEVARARLQTQSPGGLGVH